MDWKEIAVLVVIAVLLLIVQRLGRRHGKDTRAARLMKYYAVMTQEKIDNAPEGELVDGVVSRIFAKAEKQKRPDPIAVLSGLPNDNTVVYTVWVVCTEMASSDYAAMMKTAAKDLADLTHNALAPLAHRCVPRRGRRCTPPRRRRLSWRKTSALPFRRSVR